MRHFETSQWADLVRGLADERDRITMESHLASGCKKCRRIVSILGKLNDMAVSEPLYRVPEYAVRMAKEIFALQRPEKVCILPNIVARLRYDSFQEPLPAGVRSHFRSTRQALYEAGSYSLDLRLEHERGTAAVTLVGQITDRTEPDRAMEHLPVLLLSGKEVLANTFSNSLGEFQFEYQPRRHLRLYVEAEAAEERIEVPIDQLATEASGKTRIKGRAKIKSSKQSL